MTSSDSNFDPSSENRPPMPIPPNTPGQGGDSSSEQRPPMPTPPKMMGEDGGPSSEKQPLKPTPPTFAQGSSDSQPRQWNAQTQGAPHPQQNPIPQSGHYVQYGQSAAPAPQFGQYNGPTQQYWQYPNQGQVSPHLPDPGAFASHQMQPLMPQAPALMRHAPFQAPWWGLCYVGAVVFGILGSALPFVNEVGRFPEITRTGFELGLGLPFLFLSIFAAVWGLLNAVKTGPGFSVYAPGGNTVIYSLLTVYTIVAVINNSGTSYRVSHSISIGAVLLLLLAFAGLALGILGLVQRSKMRKIFGYRQF